MDLDNIQQNMNTRVTFKEPRGMIRWIQLFFAIVAFSTVVDFQTKVEIDITCPITPPAPAPSPAPNNSTPAANTTLPSLAQQGANKTKAIFNVVYPFNFQETVYNNCTTPPIKYDHYSKLTSSPQFFVMTGVLSLIYASISLTIYLFFSSTYDSLPIVPLTDLIITGILCFLWLVSSSAFGSGVSNLKSTSTYEVLNQTLCPATFINTGGTCAEALQPDWKSLNVSLVSGFTSFFLWGAGMWFVFKETHFHTPRDPVGFR